MKKGKTARYVWVMLCMAFLFAPVSALAADWWEVIAEEEIPSSSYDSILYSEIPPALHALEQSTDRLKVEVMGQSAGGRNLFLATMTSGEDMNRLSYYRRFSKLMSEDPERALMMMDNGADFKVPVYINCGIHGNEYGGPDACLRMMDTLAHEDSDEVKAILDNVILLMNVVPNPDGRIMGNRRNANYIDLNRDFITQSQPETRSVVRVLTRWNPMVALALHDDVDPMLIEPCSAPHNSNYEYDLYIKWALYQAEAMEAELMAQTGFEAQIPYRDWDTAEAGYSWDDWPPIYDAMYPMYHGAYGHTIETPYEDITGVDAHYAILWGMLNFVVANKTAMVQDQINVFWRGQNEQPQQLISDELIAASDYEQFNEFTIKDFPAAYVIPGDPSMQLSAHQPAELADFLLFNDIKVEKAVDGFTLDGTDYPAGTYVVWMDQAKRSLANSILEDGPDVSADLSEDMEFYSPPTAWSLPLLWGVFRAVMEEKMDIVTTPIKAATPPAGSVEDAEAGAYAYAPTNIPAIKATNMLLDSGVTVYRSEAPFEDAGRTFGAGTFIIPGDRALADELADDYAMEVMALSEVPADAVLMKPKQIAVYGNRYNGGLCVALKELGFAIYEFASPDELDGDVLSAYDLFINNQLGWDGLSETGQSKVSAFFENGGDYIGVGEQGVGFAVDSGLTADLVYAGGDAGDAIANIDYVPADSVAAGFREQDYAMAIYPVYFTEVPEEFSVAASFAQEDFIAAGFWPGWQDSGAAGMPVIVHKTAGTQDIALIGIEPTFRAHPRNTFRLLANAIYDAMD
jgi:hypothetical protein